MQDDNMEKINLDHVDSWKNRNVFLKQLAHGLTQLSQDDNNMPDHWKKFCTIIESEKPKSMLDVGCGCGLYYSLMNRKFPDIKYFGVDYSEDAVEIAKDAWNKNVFEVMDFWKLNKKIVSEYDLIHLGALLDIFPNWDEALNFILSLGPKFVIISRVEYSSDDEITMYSAYDEIVTYKSKHSKSKFLKIVSDNNYLYEEVNLIEGNNIIKLKKKNK